MSTLNNEDEPKRTAYLPKLKKIFENKPKNVALFTHRAPDCDAIGSILGFAWLLEKAFDCPSQAFYTGAVSHPQNVAMVNLLDSNLKPFSEYVAEEYDLRVVLDTVPVNAGVESPVSFDICIDHHKEVPNGEFHGLFINLKAGSCCATVYDIIKKLGLAFEDENDQDSKVASALLVGIATDTEWQMSDDTTEYEFKAWAELFEFRNPLILKQIINFKRPKFWTESKAEAAKQAIVVDGVGVIGMGLIPAKHRDMIADMAQEMVSWEDCNTAVAFSIVEGNRIEGSVRSTNPSISVPALCKELAGKYGVGGGKLGKGAFSIDLGGGGIDDDDDDDTQNKTWQAYKEKETKRIFRILNK